jgi:hypothetical protein
MGADVRTGEIARSPLLRFRIGSLVMVMGEPVRIVGLNDCRAYVYRMRTPGKIDHWGGERYISISPRTTCYEIPYSDDI